MLSFKHTTSTVLTLLAMAGMPSATQAMTSGTPADGDGHPAAVALIVADNVYARQFCSGVLLSGKVVLSASHCLWPARNWQALGLTIYVSNAAVLPEVAIPATSLFLKDDLRPASTRLVGEIKLNPAYSPQQQGGYANDVSAAILDDELVVAPQHLPKLPPVGLLDQLRAEGTLRSSTFTVLGYGRSERNLPANSGLRYSVTNERRVGQLGFDALDKSFIHQSQRIAKGEDGACFGDSGGPSLLKVGTMTYVVGVTSSGDMSCFATNTASRTDTAGANGLLINVLTTQAR